MSLWFFPLLLAFCAVSTLLTGVWLLLHLQALASLFRGHADVVPSPKAPRASRKSVLIALIIFNLGWIASVSIWVLAMSGEANELITSSE